MLGINNYFLIILMIIAIIILFITIAIIFAQKKSLIKLDERNSKNDNLGESFTRLALSLNENQMQNLKTIIESLQNGMAEIRNQINFTLKNNTEDLGKRVDKLTQETNQQLKEISGQVEKRLTEGFEKTTATFADVVKRLALIDEAQKRITELSTNVVSLQEILNDKRSRGAFGEIQLEALIRNVIPPEHFAMQYTLSNNSRVDCMLFLPEPTGNVAIDAKFPLESYQKLSNNSLPEIERKSAESQFKFDIKKHINDISNKYIINGETSDGALMFIPAEAIFAEIHAHYPDLVEHSHKQKVWMASPTTLMAILTTARAALKDAATRKQVHIIQKHLTDLAKDFERFQDRMDKLADHIKLANADAEQVQISSKKISGRFGKIERVELEEIN
jgi:DNA recombination protein RmuC